MKPKIIKFFYDLETTGTNPKRHSIHQISGLIEVNNIVHKEFNFKVRPNPKAEILDEALAVSGVTRSDLETYPDMFKVYRQIIKMMQNYVDKYNSKEKMWLVGFNNRKFDDVFFRAWFEQNKDQFFGSWFWTDSLDAMVLASQYLINRRHLMPTFKLHRVAKELGIVVDDSKLHDAVYDIYLTREIYRISTGIEIEL